MRINTNIASMTAQENANNVNKNLSSSLEKLSSGLRINKAADDASGMSIADKLRTQASALGQSISNANSANALVQIADKAMAEQSNILDIVKTKLIQASTQTTSDEGREAIRKDVSKLLEQLDNIAAQTNYNGINLLDTKGAEFSFQVGEKDTYDITTTTAYAANTSGLGGGASAIEIGSDIEAGNTKKMSTAGTYLLEGNTSTGTNASLDATISGKINTLTAHNGDVTIDISNESDAVKTAFANILSATSDGSLSASGDVYTLSSGNDLSLNGLELMDTTVKVDTVGAALLVDTTATGSVENQLSVTNNKDPETSTDVINIDLKGSTIDVETTSALDETNISGNFLSIKVGDSTYTTTAAITDNTDAALEVGLNDLAAKINTDLGTTGIKATVDTDTNKIVVTGTADGEALTVGDIAISGYANTADSLTITGDQSGKFLTIQIDGTDYYSSAAVAGSAQTDTDTALNSLIANINSALGAGFATLNQVDSSNSGITLNATNDKQELTIQQDLAAVANNSTASSAGALSWGTATGDTATDAETAADSASALTGTTSAKDTTNSITGGDMLSSLKNLAENGLTNEIANNFMIAVDEALSQINTVRSDFGSTQNQLDSFVRNAMTTQTNIKAAESVIRDVDYAAESANFNKQNIIAQAGTYAMSQANAVQQNVMRLLQ